jgi:hypothetical protein
MKIVLKPLKPRNPMVAPSHFRHAGSHRLRASSQRQQAGSALRRELRELPEPKRSP